MGLRTQQHTVMTTVDPLSLHTGIEVLSGNIVQTYDNETKEYVPDRTLVPLILMPYVEAADPENKQDGRQTLTGVEWYDGVPAADYSNRITAGADYEIGDGTATGFPKYALKVKKNVPADAPMQIFCAAKFTDTRRNATVRVEMAVKVYTTVYESKNYKVALDCPASWKIDPLKETTWMHTLTATLYSGSKAVAAANAAYWWEVKDEDGEWREPTDEDLELWIDCKDEGGAYKDTLTFDARMFKAASFRVRAAYYETDRPEVPADDSLVAETLVNVEMPASVKAEQVQTKGARMASDFSTPAAYRVDIYDNRRKLSDGQVDAFFQIRWKAKPDKAGAAETSLGTGRSVEFVPKDKGFSPSDTVSVYADVLLYEKYAVVTDDNGNVVTDDNGKVLIAPVYE